MRSKSRSVKNLAPNSRGPACKGCQYASSEYVQLLKGHNIRISMTETGDPKVNAKAELINNTMKSELLKGKRFTNIQQVIDAVEKPVDFYNNERPHMSIGMMAPSKAAVYDGVVEKNWTSYHEKAIRKKQAALA